MHQEVSSIRGAGAERWALTWAQTDSTKPTCRVPQKPISLHPHGTRESLLCRWKSGHHWKATSVRAAVLQEQEAAVHVPENHAARAPLLSTPPSGQGQGWHLLLSERAQPEDWDSQELQGKTTGGQSPAEPRDSRAMGLERTPQSCVSLVRLYMPSGIGDANTAQAPWMAVTGIRGCLSVTKSSQLQPQARQESRRGSRASVPATALAADRPSGVALVTGHTN